MAMQIGDIWTDVASGIIEEVTPQLQAQVKAIVVPIVEPYAITMVLLSLGGFVFGLAAYLNTRK